MPHNQIMKSKEQQKKIGFDSIDPIMMARIQALRLMDDDFMSVVFDGDIELTEFLLRILLSRDDLTVKSVMSQKEKRNLFGRSVRLDIIAEDDKGKLYNVEVQRADKGASPKRVRFNLAMLDSHLLQKDADFDALPETYIIFITEHDYYKKGKPVYEIEKTVKGTDLTFDDGCKIMYVNGAYKADDAIGHLMHDFRTADASEMYYNEIANRVRIHKQEEQGAKAMCRIFEEYGEEVRAEATATATAKARTEFVEELLKQNKLTDEEISVVAKVPLEQVRQIAERLAVTV
jgi:hypothetical protein